MINEPFLEWTFFFNAVIYDVLLRFNFFRALLTKYNFSKIFISVICRILTIIMFIIFYENVKWFQLCSIFLRPTCTKCTCTRTRDLFANLTSVSLEKSRRFALLLACKRLYIKYQHELRCSDFYFVVKEFHMDR